MAGLQPPHQYGLAIGDHLVANTAASSCKKNPGAQVIGDAGKTRWLQLHTRSRFNTPTISRIVLMPFLPALGAGGSFNTSREG